jgi:ABC-2 type transport system permease protein
MGGALLAFNALLTYVIPRFQEGLLEIIWRMPIIKPFIGAMLGSEVGDQINAGTLQAFLWVHPVVLALVWAHAILFCTRLPAGEIDRGTIDVLLGLPVSRRKVYYCEALAWLVAGLVIIVLGFAGHRLASPAMPVQTRPELSRALMAMVNLYCVYLAVGGIALLMSSLSDRRGRAMGVAFAIVVSSFLLNFLAQFWAPAQDVAFLGILQYYRPARILQSGLFPTADVAVLLTVAAVAVVAGGEVIARRSICTV